MEPITLENPELTIEVEVAAKNELRPRIKVSLRRLPEELDSSMLDRSERLLSGAKDILKRQFGYEFI